MGSDTQKSRNSGGTGRVKLCDLRDGEKGVIRGVLVQIFESNIFYQSCAQCGLTLRDGKCNEHGDAESKTGVVLNGVIDDGNGTVRSVFFKDVAEKLTGMDVEEMKNIFLNNVKNFYNTIPTGKEMLFKGYCRKNKFFDKNEFVVSDIGEVDVEWEISNLL